MLLPAMNGLPEIIRREMEALFTTSPARAREYEPQTLTQRRVPTEPLDNNRSVRDAAPSSALALLLGC